jgi:hypothetical protein
MLRNLLNRLAARILRGQVRGYVVGSFGLAAPILDGCGWVYGDGWRLEFPPGIEKLPTKITRIPVSSLDGRP